MDCNQFFCITRSCISRGASAALIVASLTCGICRTESSTPDWPPPDPYEDFRQGGVIEESYHYHRHGADVGFASRPSITPEEGWYGYGFPVKSHRWGWFGAQRYYPRVLWHKGYYGDGKRWAYRRGY